MHLHHAFILIRHANTSRFESDIRRYIRSSLSCSLFRPFEQPFVLVPAVIRDLAVKRSDSLSPAPLGESPFGEDPAVAEAAGRLPRRKREVGGSKKINEPSMFCVVYCFLSRLARARVSLNKRRALLAVSWRPAVPYLRTAIRR